MDPYFLPSMDFARIYGEDVIFAPRASPHACHWLPHDGAWRDIATGGMLPVSGETATLCSKGVSTPKALQLLLDAGFHVPGDLVRFRDAADHLKCLQKLVARGQKIVLQHVHPLSEVPPGNCWVSPPMLSFINNKANLATMTDATHIPERRIIETRMIKSEVSASNLPLVIKAVTDQSTAAGLDLVICRTEGDLKRAAIYFKTCQHVVAEKFFYLARNLCLNYAVDVEGSVTYLGCAEQVCDAEGKYLGNWLGDEVAASSEAVEIGKRVVEKGYRLGYHGYVGMDMAVLDDGRILVFDLNFRFNGSTPSLLLYKSIRCHFNNKIMLLRSLTGTGAYRDLLRGTYRAMQRHILLPLCSFDPEAGGYPCERPVLKCLVLGDSRDEVREREKELSELGFKV
jgi:hypothetical protein